MIRTTTILAALALATLGPRAHADEIRLADGRVLIGTARTVGEQVRIRTRSGETVVVAAADVVRIRTDAELRDEIAQLAERHGGPAHAELELARMAWRYGLADQTWERVDACVAAGPDGALRERLDRFLVGLATELVAEHRLRANPARAVRALLGEVRGSTSPGRVAAVEAVLASLQEDGVDDELRERARSASEPLQRVSALRALQRRDAAHEPFVWRTAVVDTEAEVRAAAMAVARDAGRSEAAVDYLAPGLVQPDGRIRIRTADAFAELGDAAAIQPLVAAGPLASTASVPAGATRAHVAFLQQQAYVRDFDVEVAMGAFIGDPKIDVLQSGVVLDVTVVAVTRMRVQIVEAYRRALVALSGDDPGPEPEAWAGWFETRPEYPAAIARADAKLAAAKAAPKKAAPGPAGPGAPALGHRGARRGGVGGGGGGGGAGIGIGVPIVPGTLPPLPGTIGVPLPPSAPAPVPGARHTPAPPPPPPPAPAPAARHAPRGR